MFFGFFIFRFADYFGKMNVCDLVAQVLLVRCMCHVLFFYVAGMMSVVRFWMRNLLACCFLNIIVSNLQLCKLLSSFEGAAKYIQMHIMFRSICF